jgi:predicted kinase
MIDGRPTLFDAIEFNDAFSCIDVLYDLAFLLMDLHRHGLRAYANVVLNRYLELSDQHAGLEALPLFIACRAAVRAHTALAASQAMSDKTSAPELRMQAANLLREAVDVLDVPRPRLVAIGGLSGTGKSTLARDLAPSLGAAPGAIVLRSDVIRKHLMGVAETVRLPQEAYTPDATERVYRRIRELSEICLKAGYSVIADAVHGRAEERDALRELAVQIAVPFTGLWLVAPPDVLATRLARRVGDASDATAAVMRSQLLVVEPPQMWVSVPASSCASDTLATAQRFLSSPD